jgi:predicted amidohydrolase YtcJ
VTHEYTILYDAIVLTGDEACPRATALAWAADTILAVGETATVRAISRGDSRFIALPGRLITPAPTRPHALEQGLREAVALADTARAESILASLGRLAPTDPVRCLRIGELADLAIWSADPAALAPREAASLRIEAVVRGGRFTRGNPIHGPYRLDPALGPQCLHSGPSGG